MSSPEKKTSSSGLDQEQYVNQNRASSMSLAMNPKYRASLKLEQESKVKKKIQAFMEGKFVTILMFLVTVFALVGDDIRLWLTEKPADPYFFTGLLISFALFTIEILINSISEDEFKYSFFFWLDIIATISIIPDIPWLMNQVLHLFGTSPDYVSVNAIPGELNEESIASGKIQQVVKSLRLIRLIRIIKLYKYIIKSQTKEPKEGNSKLRRKFKKQKENQQEEKETLFKKETDPSKLGKALSDTNTREVIIGVLLMLMVLPLLSPSEIDYSQEYGLRELFWFGRSNCVEADGFFCNQHDKWITGEGWNQKLAMYAKSSSVPETAPPSWVLLWLYVPDFANQGRMAEIEKIDAYGQNGEMERVWQETAECSGFEVPDNCPWRYEEMELVTFTPDFCLTQKAKGCEYLVSYARFNKRVAKQEEATLQFSTTLFTCFVLSIAFLVFSHDTEVIVIQPIKKVVEIIQKLAENPLKKPEQPVQQDEVGHQMKTQMLELTIYKIGNLLQRGFGELGAKIVSKTLTQTDQYMDLTIPGRKVEVVFAVCRIKQFTETTECLQDEIIVFVNKIVKIIHECTKRWDGKPTKNYGEKYLLTWILPSYDKATDAKKHSPLSSYRDDEIEKVSSPKGSNKSRNVNKVLSDEMEETRKIMNDGGFDSADLHANKDGNAAHFDEDEDGLGPMTKEEIFYKRQEICDRAVITAVKTIAELGRANDLQAYSRHPKISHKFGERYTIKMSFGLHIGSAIEGAVGSEFKIDALYLSTDQQITLRIDELCEVYDRMVLMSGDLQSVLSENAKDFTRRVDRVVMKESHLNPRDIYCIDVFPSQPLDEELLQEEVQDIGGFIRHPDYENQAPELYITRGVEHIFTVDHDFVSIQNQHKKDFLDIFEKALNFYIEGDWLNAQQNFAIGLNFMLSDGPSKYIMSLIDKHKGLQPDEWQGYRDIDKKEDPPVVEIAKQNNEYDLLDDEQQSLNDGESN